MNILSLILRSSLLVYLIFIPVITQAAVIKVIYSIGEAPNESRFNDVIEILCTALEKSRPQYGDYECLPYTKLVPKKRVLQELESAEHTINVAWNPTSIELEQRFATIRFPLRKGLLGYRVLLINKENQVKFNQIKTSDDLKKISFGQGVDWNDNAIFENHGIKVVQGKYSQLFKMLSANRFDGFPRGIGEILTEYEQNKAENPELMIEKNLLIYYPFPYYFFFNKQDQEIKERVEAGLRIMQKDGSFDAIFNKYYQDAITKLNMKSRRIIRLNNPHLPKDTPINDSKLWHIPTR
ncbi:amino acid ABC transporter substrate-binding protein [Undibacterium sp. SXout7W]|uniref:amino acid ABC transporter substrate-binding protein n=1 Tax=Undibacterium sp. SXout7W TaxID=3413049 RepID=UPI003BF3BB3C